MGFRKNEKGFTDKNDKRKVELLTISAKRWSESEDLLNDSDYLKAQEELANLEFEKMKNIIKHLKSNII